MIHNYGAPVHIFDAGEKNSPDSVLLVYETASSARAGCVTAGAVAKPRAHADNGGTTAGLCSKTEGSGSQPSCA